MSRNPLHQELTALEREILLGQLRFPAQPDCAAEPEIFDHQRQGEDSLAFTRRADAAITACRRCPALEHCDLRAQLLSITGIVGGRYRPHKETARRARAADIAVAAPNLQAQELIIARARSTAAEASRWRRAP